MLLILIVCLTLVSCTEDLHWWQESAQNIEISVKVKTEYGNLTLSDELGGQNRILFFSELVSDDSLEYFIELKNTGLEPRDGTMHFRGSLYLYVHWDNRTYEACFSSHNEGEYVELLSGERLTIPIIWDKQFDDGVMINKKLIDMLKPGYIEIWLECSILKYYVGIKTPVYKFVVIPADMEAGYKN